MLSTVEEGFRAFHLRLTPTDTETQAAISHRQSIKACLESNFELNRFYRAGSFGNGTSIRNFSDVDYMASIPSKYVSANSNTFLKKIWTVLDARFPSTGVGIRGPAIMLPFGTDKSESTDVVPAEYASTSSGFDVYNIADRSGGWMKTSPEAHNKYVSKINEQLSRKVKPLIRFIKALKYYRNIPIFSFYLEIFVARYTYSQEAIVYSIDIRNILSAMVLNELSMIQDPLSISGYIRPCVSNAYKDDALSKLVTALGRVEKAREAEVDGDIATAFDWWDKVFNSAFPSRYST